MSEVPAPEPTELDERRHKELQQLAEDAVLKGRPYQDEECRNCLYYLEANESISYCWHPKLRILVGAQWWCQWWEEPTDA